MPGQTPSLTIVGAVARIRLHRREQHNRLQREDIAALLGQLDRIEATHGIRAVAITAQGPSFSSGFDIGTLGTAESGETVQAFGLLCDRLEALRLPTICAINGGIYGGATDLALACDIRIGVHGCRMMMPPTRLGFEYFYGGLRRYVEQLGVSAAKRLLLTAETIDAETMLRIGFLHELVEPEALPSRTEEAAASCAAGAPDAVQGIKASLGAIAGGRGDPEAIQARYVASLSTPNALEGVTAWKERRRANFIDV